MKIKTAEQKQRAAELLCVGCEGTPTKENSPCAVCGKEAPEPEPVARVTGYYAGYLSIATVDGRVLPAGTALYAAPPHQSEHHLEMVNTPAPTPAEAPADVARDAERLDWLLRKLPGVVLRYCVGVLSDTSDGKEFRDAIDAAIKRQGGE